MSRPRKGARLYFRTGRVDRRTGRALPDVWVILDGAVERSTGQPRDGLPEAERILGDYILAKNASAAPVIPDSPSDPASVLVVEVLALYAAERAPELASKAMTTSGFIKKLAQWWTGKTIADVKRSSCKDYVAWRTAQRIGSAQREDNQRRVSDQTARRELEILSAAIGYWHGEHTLTSRPEVWLPLKAESQREALTRSEAAALLLAAMGWTLQADGKWKRRRQEDITNRRHIRRYALIGYYTGTRSNVKLSLLWEESARQAWVDLDKGMIWRRGKAEREIANKRRPVVRIPQRLLAHMRRWREMDRKLEAKINQERAEARRLNPALPKEAEFRLISVVHYDGKPLVDRPKRSFAACVADAGLSADVTPHYLRHTAATWLMEGGADPWDASAYLGMSPSMLEKNYGHHRPDYQAAARKASGGRRHGV